MTIDLDDAQVFQRYDPAGMLEHLRRMPEQCQQAWQMSLEFPLPADYSDVNKVLVLGMGGSAIGGDLLRSLAIAEARLPIIIHRDYDLPAFVDAKTLVIASSYSGNTEEILDAFDQTLRTSAKKLVITTGGKLKEIAEKRENVPVYRFDYPAQPRAALGFSFLTILCFLQKLGFLSDKSGDVVEMVGVLEKVALRINEKVLQPANPAKQLAGKLCGNLVVVYGAGILSEVAHRWKTQINENSKAWAFYEVFPELNHNATVGYKFPEALADKTKVVLLQAPSLKQRIQRRYQLTCELLKGAGVEYEIVSSEGSSLLSQMMSLVLFGDYVSYYVAILYRINPTPVEVINYLKEQLARG